MDCIQRNTEVLISFSSFEKPFSTFMCMIDKNEMKRERVKRKIYKIEKLFVIKYITSIFFFCLQRIMDSAEQAALSESDPEQQSQKSHNSFYDARKINVYDSDGKLADGSKHMLLRHMRRFEGLPVNVSLSSMLFPTGVELDGKFNKGSFDNKFLNICFQFQTLKFNQQSDGPPI